jgi:hypothetical protein
MFLFSTYYLVTFNGKCIDTGTAEDVSKQCSTLRGGQCNGSVRNKDVRKKWKNSTQATHAGTNVFVCKNSTSHILSLAPTHSQINT